jgi:hypothetical protein
MKFFQQGLRQSLVQTQRTGFSDLEKEAGGRHMKFFGEPPITPVPVLRNIASCGLKAMDPPSILVVGIRQCVPSSYA